MLGSVLVASAAEIRFDAIPAKRVRIARYCAMLSMYAVAGACGTDGATGIRAKRRVLKARNVSSRVFDTEEGSHEKLDIIGISWRSSLS